MPVPAGARGRGTTPWRTRTNGRRDNWLEALKDLDHDDHSYAWEILRDYIKDKWMDMLDDFFNEARRDTEYDGMCNGEPMIAHG